MTEREPFRVRFLSATSGGVGSFSPERLWEFHRAMSDAEDFQPVILKTIEEEVVLEVIHAPRANVPQVSPSKPSRPPLERLPNKPLHGSINRFEKTQGGVQIAFEEVLEVSEGIQLGVMADENFDLTHLTEVRRPLRRDKPAKWPRLYFFSGLRKEWRSASSSSGS